MGEEYATTSCRGRHSRPRPLLKPVFPSLTRLFLQHCRRWLPEAQNDYFTKKKHSTRPVAPITHPDYLDKKILATKQNERENRTKKKHKKGGAAHVVFWSMPGYLEYGDQHFRQVSHSQPRQEYRAQIGAQLIHARHQTPYEERRGVGGGVFNATGKKATHEPWDRVPQPPEKQDGSQYKYHFSAKPMMQHVTYTEQYCKWPRHRYIVSNHTVGDSDSAYHC